MKPLKFFLLWMAMTIVMVISWAVGSLIGNSITQTASPPIEDPASVESAVLIVCAVNSLVWAALFWSTRVFRGTRKMLALFLFLFGTQFFLMQLETFFFSSSINISPGQVVSILVAGFVMAAATVWAGLALTRKLVPEQNEESLKLEIHRSRPLIASVLWLSVVGYPFIYHTFGYYVAWQNEHLRVFYSNSPELESFAEQLPAFFTSGLYFFQVLRGFIWVVISIPVVLMLRQHPIVQYGLVALLCAVPSVQLFIPNPYMPWDIAMSHFIETVSSNFIWGLLIVYAINRSVADKEVLVDLSGSRLSLKSKV